MAIAVVILTLPVARMKVTVIPTRTALGHWFAETTTVQTHQVSPVMMIVVHSLSHVQGADRHILQSQLGQIRNGERKGGGSPAKQRKPFRWERSCWELPRKS